MARYDVILRYDRLGVEIPAGDPDPAGAMAAQELMGGRFGEMSTLMNYTFQSFGFRGRKELRPILRPDREHRRRGVRAHRGRRGDDHPEGP
jgi:hypothetical protein